MSASATKDYLVGIYAALVERGAKKIEDVPAAYRAKVKKKIAEKQ